MRTIALIIMFAGLAVLIAGFVIHRASRAKLRSRVLFDGYTPQQAKTVRRAVSAGRLPDNRSLAPLTLSLADELVQNIPFYLRSTPFTFGGLVIMFVGIGLTPGAILPPVVSVAGAIAIAGVGVFAVLDGLRTLRNGRELLREHQPTDG